MATCGAWQDGEADQRGGPMKGVIFTEFIEMLETRAPPSSATGCRRPGAT